MKCQSLFPTKIKKKIHSLVAELDAHLTDDHGVSVSITNESGNILIWRLSMKYFPRSFATFSYGD